MYRIGQFSSISKTTIKTLRYYEKEKLLVPSYIDKFTGYRFYETSQLVELSKIVALRQIGISLNDIRSVLNGKLDFDKVLEIRRDEIKSEISIYNDQLSRINFLLEGKEMKYEVVKKELPSCIIYYKEGIIKNFSNMVEFIMGSAEECRMLNPNIKCAEPDYCFINYLDGEYKAENIRIRYAQAVTDYGIENENIKFKKLEPTIAVTIYHKGAYENLGEAYSYIMKWIENNNYEISGDIREHYIDGMWNKENVEDWLTEIQVPVREKN